MFGAGGRWLASASHDTTVRLFEAAVPAEIIALRQKAQELHDAAKTVLDQLPGEQRSPVNSTTAVGKNPSWDDDLRIWVRKLLLAECLISDHEE